MAFPLTQVSHGHYVSGIADLGMHDRAGIQASGNFAGEWLSRRLGTNDWNRSGAWSRSNKHNQGTGVPRSPGIGEPRDVSLRFLRFCCSRIFSAIQFPNCLQCRVRESKRNAPFFARRLPELRCAWSGLQASCKFAINSDIASRNLRLIGDITAAPAALPMNFFDRSVRILFRRCDCVTQSRNAQHASACIDDLLVLHGCARVENLRIR